jgi:hypothetical protein
MLHLSRSLLFALALLAFAPEKLSAQSQVGGPDCIEVLAGNVPNGTPVMAGQEFDQVWLVRNCGSGVTVEDETADAFELRNFGMELAQGLVERLRRVVAQAPNVPEPDTFLTGPPSALPDLRSLVVPISGLPGTWTMSNSNDSGLTYSVNYRGTTNPSQVGSSSMVTLAVALLSSEQQAAAKVEETRKDLLDWLMNGVPMYEASPWDDHEGAYRIEATHGSQNSVIYVFNVGPYYGEVDVKAGGAQSQPELRSEALELARIQLNYLKSAVGPAPDKRR